MSDFEVMPIGTQRRLASLEQQVAALNQERDVHKYGEELQKELKKNISDQLAAAQLRIKELREALKMYGDHWTEEKGMYVAELLSTPDDTTALDKRLAEEREKCIEWLCNNYQNYKNLADLFAAIRSMK